MSDVECFWVHGEFLRTNSRIEPLNRRAAFTPPHCAKVLQHGKCKPRERVLRYFNGIRLPHFAGIVRLNAGGVTDISRGLSDEGAIPPGSAPAIFPHPGRRCQKRPRRMSR